MARQNNREELLAAWRALSSDAEGTDGWRTIPVSGVDSIRAGRHFPGNEEAVIIGFTAVTIPPADHLPQGKGFLVTKVDVKESSRKSWLALARRPEGSLDVFTTMVLDVIDTLESCSVTSEELLFRLFLARIRAWQDFMRRGTDTNLGPQAEIGLFGELVTLQGIINAGLEPGVPVEGWEGPLNGIQDFVMGTGAVEVKTTIAGTGFPIVIESLDQLDDAILQPLLLAAVRLCVNENGTSLPGAVSATRALIGNDPARNTLDTKLLHAGYVDATADQYKRRFVTVETRIVAVTNEFPRLTRATVPRGILGACYQLDLDQISTPTFTMQEALRRLGVL